MKSIKMRERRLKMAAYVLENAATMRELQNKFNVSLRTIHLDLGVRLKKDNSRLHDLVQKQLKNNLRHKKDNRKRVV